MSGRISVRAKPWTVASGVRRSWHASETRRANGVSSPADMADVRDLLTDDLQASAPDVALGLSRVGVTGIDRAIRLAHAGAEKLVAATIDCTVDLNPTQKGVHMSRFPELFAEAIDEVVIGEALLVETLAEHIRSEEHTSE